MCNALHLNLFCFCTGCISPFNFQRHTMVDTVEAAEKGETDSFCKEHEPSVSEDEKEMETETTEKENRSGSCQDFSQDKKKTDRLKPKSEPVDGGPGLKITHSVTIDNFGLSSPRVVFEQCHEAMVSSVIAVTITEVKCMSPNMMLEINEVVTSDDSNIKATFIIQNHRDKREETHMRTEKHQTQKNTHVCSWKQHGADYKQNIGENISYKISIAELNSEPPHASKSQSSWVDPEEMACRKSCCKNNYRWGNTGGQTDTDFTLVDGSSRSSSPSDFWQHPKQRSLPSSLSNEALWDIPPPDAFADGKSNALDFLAENVASCQITPRERFADHNNTNCTQTSSEVTLCKEFTHRNTLDSRTNKPRCESSSPQEHLFMNPRASINRSSFTKNFIDNHERKTRLRNNSIDFLESKTHPAGYMDIPPKRRKTYPGVTYQMSQTRDSIPSYRESFSSGTLSSYFMQLLPSQAERMGRFYVEDERLHPLGSRKSSSSSSSYRPSSGSTAGPDSCIPKFKAYSLTKNPFYPSRSDESPEDVFFRGEQYHGPAELDEMEQPSSGLMIVDGAPQLNEVNESGFDEEMVELDESISPGDTMERHQRELLIHVIPPSLCNSEEHINEGLPNGVKQNTCDGDKADAPKKRRGSVMTIITGDCEQRFLQGKHGFSFDEEHQIDTLSPVSESPSASPIEDLASIREAVEELPHSSQVQKNTISANTKLIVHLDMSSQQPGEVQPNEPLHKISKDVYGTNKLYKNDLSERQSASKREYYCKILYALIKVVFTDGSQPP